MPEPLNPAFVVRMPRVITTQAPEDFSVALQTVTATSPTTVTLDCTDIDQVTAAHVKLLWQAHMECSMIGAAVQLTGASYYVWKVLKALDLDSYFKKAEVLGEAFADRSSGSSMESSMVFERAFRIDASDVQTAQDEFLHFLDSLGVPHADQYVLQTIFYEVATNIRLHAGLEPSQTVHFAVESEPERVQLTFVDSGTPFNPIQADISKVTKSDARKDRKPLGLEVLHKLADRLDYRRLDDTRNVLVVERKWRMKEWKKSPSRNAS